MSASGRRYRTMKKKSTILLIALVFAVRPGDGADEVEPDQMAEEARTRVLTVLDPPPHHNHSAVSHNDTQLPPPAPQPQPEARPPSKPPIKLNVDGPSFKTLPDKHGKPIRYVEIPRQFYPQVLQHVPRPYPNGKPMPFHASSNTVYKYPKGPVNHRSPQYQQKPPRQLVFSASTGKPYIITAAKSPKFSIPMQTVNGIRADFGRPPKPEENTTTTTTTTTTQRPLRNKRIWPKHVKNKANNTNESADFLKTNSINTNSTEDDNSAASSNLKSRYVNRSYFTPSTTSTEAAPRVYRRVTRIPKHKHKSTTVAPEVSTNETIEVNDWVPIAGPMYQPVVRLGGKIKRSDRRSDFMPMMSDANVTRANDRSMMYLQSFGLVPLNSNGQQLFFRKRRSPYIMNGPGKRRPSSGNYIGEELHIDASNRHSKVITKIKHHHHHHHHKYIKTIEKKVPVKVEVPKPYPVEKKVPMPYPVPVERIVQKIVEKKVPYPVPVEKKVPYPVPVKIPHPVPVKVVEKEYVPKPYPIIHHVPVVKPVEVKVPQPVAVEVERKVPYPVEVQVPVEKRVPYPVQVEKQVPYPVPVKVFVPQPYPVEKRVPYPVEVKVREPVEVVKHVPVQVPVPQPFAVPHPVTVEKRVPYPVEVEKQIPVPFRVFVPERVEVERKVPIFIPKPYPVEKKIPVPVKVPYPVQVPVKVPVKVPVEVPVGVPVYLDYAAPGNELVGTGLTTAQPQQTVTVHGHAGFKGFSSRSDSDTSTSEPASTSAAPTTTTTQSQQ